MNILFISDVYSVGGAAKALGELAIELKRRGHHPIVCTGRNDKFSQFLTANGIENFADNHLGVMDVALKRTSWKPLIYEYVREYLRVIKHRHIALNNIEKKVDLKTIDIIHTNSARNDLGCILHRKYRIPHVMHLREFGKEDFGCWKYKLFYEAYLNKSCDRIVAVSKNVLDVWRKKGISIANSQVLYDGVDLEALSVKEKPFMANGILNMVFVGGICETKGQHIAIEALSKLSTNIREKVHLDIIGWNDPQYLDLLKKFIAKNQLEEIVSFCGERNDVGKILKEYDVGIMCSKSEGFGRVSVEYMYVGLGVIASKTGATPELLTHGVNGFLFERNNSDELANYITCLFNNRKQLVEFGKKAHAEAKARFSAVRNADEVEGLYDELLYK